MSSQPRKIVGRMLEEPELVKLVDLCLTDQASPQQWQTLSDLIVERKDVCEYYAAQAITGARLAWVSKIDEDSGREILERIEKDDLLAASDPAMGKAFSYRRVALTVGAFCAAALLLFGGIGVSLLYQNHALPKSNVATSGPVPPTILVHDVPGKTKPVAVFGNEVLDLPAGVFQATTSSGMQVEFSGPLKLRVQKPMEWRLIYGKLIATVNPVSQGFTVTTHQGSVTDLGTKFGVAVGHDNITKVAVYQGTVVVQSGRSSQQLEQGQGVRIPSISTLDTLAVVSEEEFLRVEEIAPSVITDVRHNGNSAASPYRIVRGGFREGATAYVDRVHQWSGLFAGGLSPALTDEDYVQLPNDWKYDDNWNLRDDLKITFEFSRPVVAYLLVDERLRAPAWLSERFTKTSIVIGLDKGSHSDPRTNTRYQLPQIAGPGNSIDVSLRVWKITLPEGGSLEIGPIGHRSSDWVVPGLVTRPL
ncbi:FecR domain-containing protein [Bremerella sp. JC770]|uniref:FecR domain-containing protein n=1 Tax=Bremerella sp. JC770 TaxID=3232137 RepID=UPI003458B706